MSPPSKDHPSIPVLHTFIFCFSASRAKPAQQHQPCGAGALGGAVLLLLQCMTTSNTSCSSQINPNPQLCKVSSAESAILTKGRKTEAFNHKPLPHFLLYRDRMKRAGIKTTSLICTSSLLGLQLPCLENRDGPAQPSLGTTWHWPQHRT